MTTKIEDDPKKKDNPNMKMTHKVKMTPKKKMTLKNKGGRVLNKTLFLTSQTRFKF